jgi:hypothetical protein
MRSEDWKKRIRQAGISLALCMGILSPLSAFPITSSCIPLASYLFCTSLTCIVLLAIFWSPSYRAASLADQWSVGSPKLKWWTELRQVIYALGAAIFVVSLCFFRRWHQGQINWQMTISAPGYMFLIWGGLISTYVQARAPSKQSTHGAHFNDLKPIRSEHWGRD